MLLPEETACSCASKAVLRCLKKLMYVLCTLGFFSQLETTLSTPLSAISIHSKPLSYSGLTRVSTEECLAWILGINSRMTFENWLTFKVCTRMTENGVFRSNSNFSQKWQKPRVKALKRSEIKYLGFTERERDLC